MVVAQASLRAQGVDVQHGFVSLSHPRVGQSSSNGAFTYQPSMPIYVYSPVYCSSAFHVLPGHRNTAFVA